MPAPAVLLLCASLGAKQLDKGGKLGSLKSLWGTPEMPCCCCRAIPDGLHCRAQVPLDLVPHGACPGAGCAGPGGPLVGAELSSSPAASLGELAHTCPQAQVSFLPAMDHSCAACKCISLVVAVGSTAELLAKSRLHVWDIKYKVGRPVQCVGQEAGGCCMLRSLEY